MPDLIRPNPRTSADLISEECDALKALLLRKDAAYGSSALDPVRIFSRADPVEQLRVRIDDKLSRIARADPNALGEDVVLDLLGYLVLFRIATRRQREIEAAPRSLTIRQEIDGATGATLELLKRRGIVRVAGEYSQGADPSTFVNGEFLPDILDALADVLDPPSPAPLDDEEAGR